MCAKIYKKKSPLIYPLNSETIRYGYLMNEKSTCLLDETKINWTLLRIEESFKFAECGDDRSSIFVFTLGTRDYVHDISCALDETTIENQSEPGSAEKYLFSADFLGSTDVDGSGMGQLQDV